MTAHNKWKMISRTRDEYMDLKEKRERTVGQGTLYTSLILLDGFPEAFILPATIEADAKGLGTNAVRFCIKHPYDFSTLVESPGSISDGLWLPDPSDKLEFTKGDKSRNLIAEESYFLPYDDGMDLTEITNKEFLTVDA